MCTRIFNSHNQAFPVTARNMDWFSDLSSYLYTFTAGESKTGLSKASCALNNISPEHCLNWTSNYASISTMMGDDALGYGTVDGMNSQGLTVNSLFDSYATYNDYQSDNTAPVLSALRWPQFVLDSFDCVAQAVNYFESHELQLITEKVPDGSELDCLLHLTLSDTSGDSAIIEVVAGKCHIYHDKNYTIATNQPSYTEQLNMTQYWQYQWGLTEPKNNHPVYTSPGGSSSTQRFERASFYLAFSQEAETAAGALSQTRSLVSLCLAPPKFNPQHSARASSTIWCNLSEHSQLRYYYLNTLTMTTPWLSLAEDIHICQRVAMVSVSKDETINHVYSGDLNSQLSSCADPFKA